MVDLNTTVVIDHVFVRVSDEKHGLYGIYFPFPLFFWRYIYEFAIINTKVTQVIGIILKETIPVSPHNQYHECSWPNDTRSHGISSFGITVEEIFRRKGVCNDKCDYIGISVSLCNRIRNTQTLKKSVRTWNVSFRSLRTCNFVVANPKHMYAGDRDRLFQNEGQHGEILNNFIDIHGHSYARHCRNFPSKFKIIDFSWIVSSNCDFKRRNF